MERKAYLSAPAYNDQQEAMEEKMFDLLEGAGFSVFRAGRDEMDLHPDKRAEKVEEADLLVFNLDGLLPKGVSIRMIGPLQSQLTVPFQGQIMEAVNAGWAALGLGGGAMANQGKSILLPGEVEQQANAPRGMQVGLPQGAALTHILSPPMNITDPNVLVEIGMGVAFGKAVICFAVGDVQCGGHVREESVTLVEDFEDLSDVIKRLGESEDFNSILAEIREAKKLDATETVEAEAGE